MINGQSSYKFIFYADDNPDTFCINIDSYEDDSKVIVYDNDSQQLWAAEIAVDTT